MFKKITLIISLILIVTNLVLAHEIIHDDPNPPFLAKGETSTLIPPGSYQDSCRSCLVQENQNLPTDDLVCGCFDRRGRIQATSIHLRDCVPGTIWNNDGALRCEVEGVSGSFAYTCGLCMVEEGVIKCRCRVSDSRRERYTSQRTNCAPLTNCDGHLTCNGEGC